VSHRPRALRGGRKRYFLHESDHYPITRVARSIINVNQGLPIGSPDRGSMMCTSQMVWSISTTLKGRPVSIAPRTGLLRYASSRPMALGHRSG